MKNQEIKSLQVKEILQKKEVIKVDPTMSARDLTNLFAENNITGAPVIDKNNQLLGVVSVADITRVEGILELKVALDLMFISAPEDIRKEVEKNYSENHSEPTVYEIMTPHPITVTPEDTVEAAIKLMLQEKVRRVIVLKDNQIEGVLTITDILNLVLQ
jgi:CBS domain-containing protein